MPILGGGAPLGKHPSLHWLPAVPSPARKPVTVAVQEVVHPMLADGVPATMTGIPLEPNSAPLSKIELVLGLLAPPEVSISYVPPPMPTNRLRPTFISMKSMPIWLTVLPVFSNVPGATLPLVTVGKVAPTRLYWTASPGDGVTPGV